MCSASAAGRYDQALELYERGRCRGGPAEAVAVELARAIVLYRQGKIDECATAAARAAEGASALDDRASLADAYYVRAAAEGDRGGPAREFLDRALAIFDELGLLERQATVLNNMGVRAYYEGAWDDALELYHRSEEVVRRAGDVLTGGHATNNRAEILLDQGRLDEAAELFDVALRTYRAAKFPAGEALVMINLGRLAAEEGRFEEAHRYLDDARAQLEALGADELPDRGRRPPCAGVHPRGSPCRRGRAGDDRPRADAQRRGAQRSLGVARAAARSRRRAGADARGGGAAFRGEHSARAVARRRVRARAHACTQRS